MLNVKMSGLFGPLLEGGHQPHEIQQVQQDLCVAHRELMARRKAEIGFYEIPFTKGLGAAVLEEAKRLNSISDDLIVLGIGGSSLGGQAFTSALSGQNNIPNRVHFVDNVDPTTLSVLLDRLDPRRTTVVVISKSGATIETLSHLLIIRRWFRVSVGQGELRKRLTFVTDPQKGLLRQLALKEGIRSFEIPENVGGRFSVLTAVGLLPAAFVGIDIEAVLEGAQEMSEAITQDTIESTGAFRFAAGALFALREYGSKNLVLMPYADALRVTSQWFVQLWAESLGKRVARSGEVVHAGQTPIAAIGATDQHAQVQLFMEGPRDKVVVLVSVKKFNKKLLIPNELDEHEEVSFLHGRDLGELLDAERRGTRAALLAAGVPVIDVELDSLTPKTFGGLLMLLEGACSLMGMAMGINPFDQPGVEAGKRMALGLMGRSGFEPEATRVELREGVGA